MVGSTEGRRAAEAGLLSVIIAANNEAAWIGRSLVGLLTQDAAAGRVQIVVSANACSDGTERVVARFAPQAAARGWELVCLSHPEPGKVGALNRGDAAARGEFRAYLDADVLCEPTLLGQIREALDRAVPVYATGTLAVAQAQTWVTRAYADVWTRLPFVRGGAVGAGFFAVNALGRERWGVFPDIISDDTYVRLSFAPHERCEVPARYHWPMVEGWRNLVRVRRRQDAGVAEIYTIWPERRANEGKQQLSWTDLARLFLITPRGFCVYAAVMLAVRMRQPTGDWSRGR